MTRKIDRGKPLEELTKGSFDYALHMVRRAFYRAFPDTDTEWYWVEEVFEDYLVVNGTGLAVDEYYYVEYSRDGDGTFIFTPRDDWEVVELTYRPRTQIQESKGADRTLFIEEITASMQFAEAVEAAANPNGPWRVKAHGITADIVNYNNHRYPAYATSKAVRDAKRRLKESGKGRLVLSGEVDHPSDKGHEAALMSETTFMWDKIDFTSGKVLIEGTMFGTASGRDMYARMQGGLLPDISQRAWGRSVMVTEGEEEIEEITEYIIAGYDTVTEGADPFAGVEKIESNKPSSKKKEEESTMSTTQDDKTEEMARLKLEKEQALKESIDMVFDGMKRSAEVKAKVREYVDASKPQTLAEARRLVSEKLAEYDAIAKESRDKESALRKELGLSETDDLATAIAARNLRLKELETGESRRKVETYIDEQTKSVNYPDHIKEAFIKSVKAEQPETEEAAKEAITKHKTIYGEMAAKHALFMKGLGHIEVLGPTIEKTGYPEFTLASYEINEALAKRSMGRMHGYYNKPIDELSINERLALQYLQFFDSKHQHHLVRESQMFSEAEQATDLSLPYSVMRAVVPEVWAALVAGSIFNFGVASQSPEHIFYEVYAGETGLVVAITNEDFNSGTFAADANGLTMGPWVQLAHKNLIPGTVVVNIDGGGALITDDGTNYVVDYARGKIRMIDGGSSNANVTTATAYEVDYQYRATREGENTEIQQAKLQLTSKILEAAAERLGSEITREAVLFSRSQLSGYDAVTRTIANIISQVRNDIDTRIFYMALSAALQVANNSGGTWTASTGTAEELIKLIGYAKVKLESRHYMADAVIASLDIANRISDADQFSAAGARADSAIDAAGYVVDVKGMPLFKTTNFSDSFLLVVNRELVFHRVFEPMVLEGPYPSYGSNGKLKATKQYYVEEFNGTDAPLPEKASYVKIS